MGRMVARVEGRGLVWQSGTDRRNLDQSWNLRALQSDRKHWLTSCPIEMTGDLAWCCLDLTWAVHSGDQARLNSSTILFTFYVYVLMYQ